MRTEEGLLEIVTGALGWVVDLWMQLKGGLPIDLQAGMTGLEKYFFGKLLGAFVPAFFLAGAIGSWISKGAVVKYLSPKTPKRVAYTAATVAGGLLSVCACGILPIFSAIYSRGAGIGPAITFLFAGPAINLIAIFYTFDLIGTRVGVARILGTLVLAVGIGLLFERIFGDEPSDPTPERKVVDLSADEGRTTAQTLFPMAWMVIATIVLPTDLGRFFPSLEAAEGASWLGRLAAAPELAVKLGVVGLSVAMVTLSVFRWFTAQERREWLEKTWFLLKQIVPKVMLGVFLTGILEKRMGTASVLPYIGTEGLASSFLASLVGGLLYFGTILGVVAARFFQVMGVPDGPLLALLLAGPTVTLPSVLAITEILGAKRAYTYFAMVVVGSALAGWILGALPL